MSDFCPLVSIVIPVYNGANYMREAIDSALAQTYDHCEVLVINDGSTDGGETDRIACSYGNKIRYFYKENGGVATALNHGIREMRGEYFSWLSHDDVYLPQKVEKQLRFMKAFELQDAVLYSDYRVIDAAGAVIAEKHLASPPPDACFQYLYLNTEIHGCSLLIPRQAFTDVGMFPEHLETTQDYDLWLRMCRVYPFVHQAEKLILSRAHAAQGSRTIQGHRKSIKTFYEEHLPGLLEITTSGKTSGEAGRSRVRLMQQLYRANLDEQAEAVAQLAASDQERASIAQLRQTIAWKRRRAHIRQLIKKILSPIAFAFPQSVKRICKTLLSSCKKRVLSLKNADSKTLRLNFKEFYMDNKFGAVESFSGGGSSLFQTRIVRRELPRILQHLQVRTMLDIPCGDFNWMQHVELGTVRYIGGDIVAELISRNKERHGSAERIFECLDAVNGPLPTADLIFCRDCLVHLPFVDAVSTLKTFKESGARWLLSTTFIKQTENHDLAGCLWRPLNLCLPPFNLPEPVMVLDEKCVEDGGIFPDKALGLWDLYALTWKS